MIDTRVRAIFELNQPGNNSTELIVSGTGTDEINIMRHICDNLIKKFIDYADLLNLYFEDNTAPNISSSDKLTYNIQSGNWFLTRGMLTFAGENSTSLGDLFGFFDQDRFYRIKKGIIDPKFYQELTKEDFEILPIGLVINKKTTLELQEPRSEHLSVFNNPDDDNKQYLRIEEHGQVKDAMKKGWPLYGQFTPKGFNKFK